MNEKDVKKNSLRAWVLAARPKTLTGAAVPVMIGLAMAWADGGGEMKWMPAILCVLFAFVMQVDANFVNDYFDFVRGNDNAETRLGPLRACTQGWVSATAMKWAIALTTCLAGFIGLPLVWYGGGDMVYVGLLCVLFCFLYTTHLSYIGMGDLLVLVFFGIVPVCVSYYLQTGRGTWQVVVASLACGVVVDCLLLVNNYRDRDNDRRAGKNTLVVKLGARTTEWLYLALGVVATAAGAVHAMNGHWLAFVLPMVYLVLHIETWRKMCRINKGRALNECLGETARNIFIYGLTLSIGLIF